MNLKEYAEKAGITLAEAKKQTGLTHWKQEVIETESKQEVAEQVSAPIIKAPVIETKSKQAEEKQDLTDPKQFSIFILGNKSPYWNK